MAGRAITASRNLERLRSFFRFCLDARWIDSNPAKAVRPPKVVQAPTLPFEPEEYERLLAASEHFSAKGVHREGNRARLKALIMLLRHSGLAAILGQMTTGFPLSPLTASTFILLGLSGVSLREHQRYFVNWAFGTTIVRLLQRRLREPFDWGLAAKHA